MSAEARRWRKLEELQSGVSLLSQALFDAAREIATLRSALEAVQWDHEDCCPICGGTSEGGHYLGCPTRQALG